MPTAETAMEGSRACPRSAAAAPGPGRHLNVMKILIQSLVRDDKNSMALGATVTTKEIDIGPKIGVAATGAAAGRNPATGGVTIGAAEVGERTGGTISETDLEGDAERFALFDV